MQEKSPATTATEHRLLFAGFVGIAAIPQPTRDEYVGNIYAGLRRRSRVLRQPRKSALKREKLSIGDYIQDVPPNG